MAKRATAKKTTSTAAGASSKGANRAHQVFVAYSYKLYPKQDFRKVFKALESEYKVTFIFADEKITNMHIMKKIETFIKGSDFSLFDISGWNPNVTLELGFAMAAGDQWYICIDPTKTEIKEVPSDLRGLDRIQYESYSELEEKLRVLLEQRYPKRTMGGIEPFLDEQTAKVRALLNKEPGLTMTAIAEVLGINVQVAKLVVRPLMEDGALETTGQRKGMKYYPAGKAPRMAKAKKQR